MNTKNLKNVLEVIRVLVKKNRVAYKDYLGEETVSKVLAEAVCDNNSMEITVKDPEFTGFVAGQTYTVTIDGEASEWVAVSFQGAKCIGPHVEYVLKNNVEPDDPTGMWAIVTIYHRGKTIHILDVWGESYIGKKFVVSQTVTQKKYDVKKLPEELLPDRLMKKVHVHANKDLLDSLTEQDLNFWDSKSNFSGSYNDLTDKPTQFGAVQKIESSDQSNPVVLRTLASGAYILNGYFKTYAGTDSDSDLTIDSDRLAVVHNGTFATGIQIFDPDHNVVEYWQIFDTSADCKSVVLKNIVQPDWAQEDTIKDDYIKNRPFYDSMQYLFVDRSKVANPPVTSSNGTFCKVSDIIVKPDQTLNLVWYDTFGCPSVIQSGSDKITTANNAVVYSYYTNTTNGTIVFVAAANVGSINSTITDTFPEPGIYFPVETTIQAMEGEVSVLKKIDNKFLDLSAYATKAYVDNLIANLKKSE